MTSTSAPKRRRHVGTMGIIVDLVIESFNSLHCTGHHGSSTGKLIAMMVMVVGVEEKDVDVDWHNGLKSLIYFKIRIKVMRVPIDGGGGEQLK